MGRLQSRIGVLWPAAPGNATTIILCALKLGKIPNGGSAFVQPFKSVDDDIVDAIEVTWLRNDQASAANGLRLYAVDDTGTYREVDAKNDSNAATIGSAAPIQIPTLSAGQEYRVMIDVSRYINGWALEYTAGATGPTNWNGAIVLHQAVMALMR